MSAYSNHQYNVTTLAEFFAMALYDGVIDMGIDVSILFATYRRPEALALTLESFARLETRGLRHEIIVIDNDDGSVAPDLVRSFRDRAPVRALVESTPGKNHALIAGLREATGKLLVFTDDDVLADPHWLNALVSGAARYPDASFFGGRILPDFPEGSEVWARRLDFNYWFFRSAYGVADWPHEDGGSIDAREVWGPNMAVRRQVFDEGLSFDPSIGPSGSDYAMGSETEFLLRVQAAGFKGAYLRGALVHHCIRREQMSEAWLLGRARRMGRGQAAMSGNKMAPRILGVPRHLYRRYAELRFAALSGRWRDAAERFRLRIELELVRGQIAQCRQITRRQD